MQIEGKILEIFETVQIKDTFRKREFVLEYAENPQFPEFIKFEMIQDKCDLLDHFEKGDNIEVTFNLKGRKWTDPEGVVKYFTSLQAWRLDKVTPKKDDDLSFKKDPSFDDIKEPDWLQGDSDEDELPF